MPSVTVNVADKATLDQVLATGNETLTEVKKLKSDIKRYGVKVRMSEAHPSNRVEYIHDAVGMTPAKMNYTTGAFDYGDWANIWFVRENYPVMLKYDGSIDYELDHDNVAYKANTSQGTASDITNVDYAGNAMSRIPLVWVSMSMDQSYEYISVSQYQYDESYYAIAHTLEDGTVMNELFLAMYQGSDVTDTSEVERLRSLSDQWPIWEKNAQTEINLAKANNPAARTDTNGWYTRTWGQRQLINALLLIMGKSDNSQEVYGRGVVSTYVDNRELHYGMVQSGTLNDKGQFYGYNDGTHSVKVFYMEDWWGNQWERIAGLIYDNGITKVSLTGPYNLTGEGYDIATRTPPTGSSGGQISKVETSKYGRIPVSTVGGSTSTYLCDSFWFRVSDVYYLRSGDNNNANDRAGITSFSPNETRDVTRWYDGASLSYLGGPVNAA